MVDMAETAGDALQHGALTACVFAGDCQNSEKNAKDNETNHSERRISNTTENC